MSRVFLGVMACALTLAPAVPAQAKEFHHRDGRHVVVRPYYHDHGVRFTGGYYYRAEEHPVWANRSWDVVHRRYHYYDPDLRCYYYWAPQAGCYYPDTYVCP